MASQANKSKLAIRKMVATESISASDLDNAERILARLVALGYVGDHPDLFKAGSGEQSGLAILSSSAVPSLAPTALVTEDAEHE